MICLYIYLQFPCVRHGKRPKALFIKTFFRKIMKNVKNQKPARTNACDGLFIKLPARLNELSYVKQTYVLNNLKYTFATDKGITLKYTAYHYLHTSHAMRYIFQALKSPPYA